MSYMTISSQENHHFSLRSYLHAHPTTLLLKALGGPMHGPSPTSNFWGAVPPRSPPLVLRIFMTASFLQPSPSSICVTDRTLFDNTARSTKRNTQVHT